MSSPDYLEKGLLWKVELEEPIPKRAIGFCTPACSAFPASARFVEIVESGLQISIKDDTIIRHRP